MGRPSLPRQNESRLFEPGHTQRVEANAIIAKLGDTWR
jgi:hypothetical protein